MSRLKEFLLELKKEELLSMIKYVRSIASLEKNDIDILIDELTITFQKLVNKSIILQNEGKKNAIKYISLSILLSSIASQNYSLGINLYDESLLLDDVEIFTEWNIKDYFTELDADIINAERILEKRFIRIKKYEMLELRHKYSFDYYGIFLEAMTFILPLALDKVDCSKLNCAEKIVVTSGLYMESQEIIYTWEVVK